MSYCSDPPVVLRSEILKKDLTVERGVARLGWLLRAIAVNSGLHVELVLWLGRGCWEVNVEL